MHGAVLWYSCVVLLLWVQHTSVERCCSTVQHIRVAQHCTHAQRRHNCPHVLTRGVKGSKSEWGHRGNTGAMGSAPGSPCPRPICPGRGPDWFWLSHLQVYQPGCRI